MIRPYGRFLAGAALCAALTATAMAQDKPDQPDKPMSQPAVKPETIWPASLARIAGRYVFGQVASPGGFWEVAMENGKPRTTRQLSINEVPAAYREQLTHAEITLSDLKLPSTVTAEEHTSPSGRGKLRYYEEQTTGQLVMKGIPGIGGDEGDSGTYSGPVTFTLAHQSHSNPSVSGILQMRLRQEPTWGVAVTDYADLHAVALPVKGDDEGKVIIGNARILRSGVEIFAYTEWQDKDAPGYRVIHGSVRFLRVPDNPGKPADPAGTAKTSFSPAGK